MEQQPMPDAHSTDFWHSVASTFKSNPAVVFDVFNEPYDPTDPRSGDDGNAADAVTWGCWASGTKPDVVGGGAPPVPCYTQAYDSGNPTTPYQIVGMQTLVYTIRDTGAAQPVWLAASTTPTTSTQWADHAPNDPLNQEAASFHNYMGKSCDNACLLELADPPSPPTYRSSPVSSTRTTTWSPNAPTRRRRRSTPTT